MAAKAARQETPQEEMEGRQAAAEQLHSIQDRQQAETHYWITFNQNDDDPVDMVDIGAAGVSYHIRKGQRVPLPQSAINCLKMAVEERREPVMINDKRYFRVGKRQRFNYTIDGTCTPQEARAWRREQSRSQTAGLIPDDDDNGLQERDDQAEVDEDGLRMERRPGD